MIRVSRDEKRVERFAQKARVLAGRDAAVAKNIRVRDERRHRRVFDRLQLGDRAAIGGVKLLGVAQADVVNRRCVAGQAVISRRIVVLHPVIHRTDLGEAIDDRRKPRQMLADTKTGLAGGDRLELAANSVGRIGLHVEGVEVRRPAELVQQDDVLGASSTAGALLGPQERGQCAARRFPPSPPGASGGVRARRPT